MNRVDPLTTLWEPVDPTCMHTHIIASRTVHQMLKEQRRPDVFVRHLLYLDPAAARMVVG